MKGGKMLPKCQYSTTSNARKRLGCLQKNHLILRRTEVRRSPVAGQAANSTCVSVILALEYS
jgi:hypothetical protein